MDPNSLISAKSISFRPKLSHFVQIVSFRPKRVSPHPDYPVAVKSSLVRTACYHNFTTRTVKLQFRFLAFDYGSFPQATWYPVASSQPSKRQASPAAKQGNVCAALRARQFASKLNLNADGAIQDLFCRPVTCVSITLVNRLPNNTGRPR